MKHAIFALGLALASQGAVAGVDMKLPAMTTQTLDNGVKLQLMARHNVPLIDVVVLVKTGAVHDGKAGLAWLTGNSLLQGTQALTKGELESELDSLGASMEVSVSEEGTELHSQFMAKDKVAMLALIKDVLSKPRFNDDDFANLKALHLADLAQARESPREVIKPYFKRLAWGDNPFANPVAGSQNGVADIALADVKGFYQRWYNPGNVVVSAAGDFEAAAFAKALGKSLGNWQTGREAPRMKMRAPAVADKARVLIVNKPDATETTFMIGSQGFAASSPDWARAEVLNTVLGGRFTSWLNQALRVEKGYTYGAGSRFYTTSSGGLFYISTFTRNATSEPAIDLALATYQKLFTGKLDQATLASAKSYLIGQFPPKLSTNDALASAMSRSALYGLDMNRYGQFGSEVESLTLEQAKALIPTFFPEGNLQLVLIGNAAELRKFAGKYGEVIETGIDAKDFSF
ncbi:M16 family metallopeptidase [Gallaecimonas pentaromativorans]|uniref:Putative Zn-dependent peptidase n=1 Tax=Gallaecimonas pentaromativorans TaxID=584787 RepID=A0A3N1PQT0_9GAMM|nr:pitrilysin family protein [Gallaecimonas pentaromativorans]ROQ30358.1 putative Zn-dependent peptidase [Gallaecimonas pentaromativorans]